MANSHSLLLPLLVFFLFSLLSSSSTATEAIPKAIEILSDSGYQYMSLAMRYGAESISSKMTIFAPPDSVFANDERSLDLLPIRLRLHLLFSYVPPHALKLWPARIMVPTLLDGQYLTVTTPNSNNGAVVVSLNKVPVNEVPVYDDGSVIVYKIDKLFPLLSFVQPPLSAKEEEEEEAPYREAGRVLRSKGWSTMAAVLEMELGKARVTVFAPVDKVLENRITDPNQFTSIVLRHVVLGRLTSSDLLGLRGSALTTKLKCFKIFLSQNFQKGGAVLEVNGVSVIMPDMYQNDWLVVHGIGEVLELPPQHGESYISYGENDEARPSVIKHSAF